MNEDTINKLDTTLSCVKGEIEEILKKTDAFLREPSLKGYMSDLQHVHEACAQLLDKSTTMLSKDVLTKQMGNPDFATYLANSRHDLLNPLSVINGYLEMISEENSDFAPEIHKMLLRVNKIVDAIHGLKE